jgi:hypothetical protein
MSRTNGINYEQFPEVVCRLVQSNSPREVNILLNGEHTSCRVENIVRDHQGSLATSRVFDTGRTDITHEFVWRSGNLDVPQFASVISTERLPVRLVSPRGTRQPPAIPERDYKHAVWSSVFVELADARIGQLRQRDFVVLRGITCDF